MGDKQQRACRYLQRLRQLVLALQKLGMERLHIKVGVSKVPVVGGVAEWGRLVGFGLDQELVDALEGALKSDGLDGAIDLRHLLPYWICLRVHESAYHHVLHRLRVCE